MPSSTNIRLYTILAVVFGILGIGIFLYPGAPFSPIGWLIRALVLAAFGVFLWLLLQDLRLLDSTVSSYRDGAGAGHSTADKPEQIEIEFPDSQPELKADGEIDASAAYHQFQKRLLEIIQETFVTHSAVIYVADLQKNALVLQDKLSSAQQEIIEQIEIESSLPGKVLLDNSAVLLNTTDEEFDQSNLNYYSDTPPEIKSFLAVPLRYNGSAIGVLAIDDITLDAYSPDDGSLLERYADLISNAMVQLDVIDQLHEQRDFYSQLLRINSTLSLSDTPEALLDYVIDVIKKLFDYDRLSIILLQEKDSDQAELAKVDGIQDHLKTGYRFELSESTLQKVIREGKPHIIRAAGQISAETKLFPWDTDENTTGMESILMAPIVNHTEKYGAIVLESRHNRQFNRQKQEILMMLGSIVGGGLNRFYLYRYMKNIATKDGLTGVGNHRAFQEQLDNEIKRSERYESVFTLLVVDLDNFKQVNDSLGHLYGDYMLKTVANLITENIRVVDFVARYGGDEFTVILVNAKKADTVSTAERIRQSILDFQFEKDGVTERIAASIGLAEFPTDGESGDVLIHRADEAMYQVKQVGGNAVQTYQHENETEEV